MSYIPKNLRVLPAIMAGAAIGAFASIPFVDLSAASQGQAAQAQSDDSPPVEATRRTISNGTLIGTAEENGVHVWRSVPYGASTAGDNRWRAPKPAPAWEGVKDVTQFGPRCPQTANVFNEIDGLEYGQLGGSEDCLSLDIYAPADALTKAQTEPLPVMLWIHGGSNVSGTSQIYKAHRLAQNENVIVVGVQYRLGPLGFFAHPEIGEEGVANFAILDLIASLDWVQKNIAQFGGNPDLVTIFGESAGGHNVTSLLAAPKAEGLFHRAIIQSGSFDSIPFAQASGEVGNEVNSTKKITEKIGSDDPETLRALSIADLFKAYDIGTGFTQIPTIIQDGGVLPRTALRGAFSSKDTFHNVPIITGTNRDEMKLFQLADPKLTKKLFGVFYQARNQKLYDTASDYSSRVWRIRSVDNPAHEMNLAGHDSVYGYRFDWDDGGSVLFTDLSKMLGAAHAMEIPFVFDRYVLLGDSDKHMFQKKTAKSRAMLSRAMGRYWANFARTGMPSGATSGETVAGEALPAWPKYSANGTTLLRLDAVRKKSDRGIETIPGSDTLDKLYADLALEPRVNAKKRCQIAIGITDWVPSLASREAGICPANNVGGR